MNLRIDRLATLYCASPILHRRPTPRSAGVPILMYHSISDQTEGGKHAYYRTTTSRRVFSQHMSYLSAMNYATTSVADVAQLRADSDQSLRRIVITFDDGYRDFYRQAAPILERFGFTATVFLPTHFIGNSPIDFKHNACMTWSEVRELHKRGFSFGSHTASHPQLYGMSFDSIDRELTVSKRTLEQELGCPIHSFAYPYAFPEHKTRFTSRLRNRLQAAGYTCGVCTSIGRNEGGSDPFFMKRVPVNSEDDLTLLKAKLAGAYDWLAYPQRWFKRTTGLFVTGPDYADASGL